MKNKLFLIEGLPCSGKSTTSKYIAELLKKQEVDIIKTIILYIRFKVVGLFKQEEYSDL